MKKEKKENITTENSDASKKKIIKITLNIDASSVSDLIEKKLKELKDELSELNVTYYQENS